MNDRYLFKAKDVDTNEWNIGFLVGFNPDYGRCFIKTPTNEEVCYANTLCQNFQCGGCSLDEKPIWENDIVATDDGIMGIVRFGLYDSTHFGFYIEWLKKEYWRHDIVYWLPRIRSIANIFDNPELLEAE